MVKNTYYGFSEYAARVDVSPAWISKLVKNGKIIPVLDDDGKKRIDPEQADPVVKYRPAGRATSKVKQRNGSKRKPETPSDELPELTEDASHDDLDRIKLFEQCRKLRLAHFILQQ